MSAIIQPIALLLIILAGYAFKRAKLFGQRDYRIMQTAIFNMVLPGAIVYSFATNPHDTSLLWISVFGFVVAFIPPVVIYLTTLRKPVANRAFMMLNGSGFNVGCFCFPVVSAFLGTAAIVPAAMFDIGNCVMVAAGTNVMTQTLLHIQPGKTLTEQHAGQAPTLPYTKPKDKDARRLARKALARNIAKSFFGSVSFDTYALMIILTIAQVHIPDWIATMTQPLSNANSFCAMLMVGMLMDLPASRSDVKEVLAVIGWRIPFATLFCAAAWFLLPFSASIREAVALCCLAPIAVFSTLFTDRVLGNARLAGFSLTITAVISLAMMTGAHFLFAALGA
ncbi:AEC family transporter [Bifidobacterium panos]|uniref:Permease n=1 Tax=Bifidobacterium panos TaxID=2675321 RepID=A0ABX1SW43_9BIFI|nr:AEC family transporter [Bifidobacterium sp. DSM 109963]NMN02060.1 permease [Bifidobacterium sp. DSM 109963]